MSSLAALAVALGLVLAPSAHADSADDGGTGVGCGSWVCGVGASDPGNSTQPINNNGGDDDPPPATGGQQPAKGGGSTKPKCPIYTKAPTQPAADSELWEGHTSADGYVGMITPECLAEGGYPFFQFMAAGKAGAPAGPTPQQVAEDLSVRARELLILPSLPVHYRSTKSTWDPDGTQLAVNMPTWFWVDRSEVAVEPKTVTAGSVSVTAQAELVSITVSPGERTDCVVGENVPCGGPYREAFDCADPFAGPPESGNGGAGVRPGSSFAPCGYMYRWRSLKARTAGSGKWQATVTAHWRVTWTSTGAGGAGGVIDVPPASTVWPLQIGEWRTRAVCNPGSIDCPPGG